MKKLFLCTLLLLSVSAISAKNKEKRNLRNEQKNALTAGSCMSTNYIVIDGYVFDYTVAYQTSNGTCDPCFATDSYAMLRYNGSTIEEGVPSTWGLGFATGVNMSYCPV